MHQCYPFIDRTSFMDAASSPNQTLAFVSLKYAVALHSTSLADPGSPDAAALYRAARSSLEASETENPGSLSELPFIQTWILVIIYEFRHVDFFRAWMTAGRAIRLAKALHMHKMDAPAPCQQQTRRPGFDPTMSPTCNPIEIVGPLCSNRWLGRRPSVAMTCTYCAIRRKIVGTLSGPFS